MDKRDIIEFFDRYANEWDDRMVRDDEIINQILINAGVREGKDILDVACGTGVLIPDYLDKKVNSVTAIDISPKMINIAKSKFLEDKVHIICGDVENYNFERKFDCIVVYNAFPHFAEQKKLIKILAGHLKEKGTLTIAHGMSRDNINKHHQGAASKVSQELVTADELALIMGTELEIIVNIANNRMYQVTGVNKLEV